MTTTMNTSIIHAKLSKADLKECLARFKKGTQAYKIVKYLANNRAVPTSELIKKADTRNLSEVVRSSCNPNLQDLGLVIRCDKPLVPYRNKVGQDLGQFEWSLFRVIEDEQVERV